MKMKNIIVVNGIALKPNISCDLLQAGTKF